MLILMLREMPSDAQVISHALMLRAGLPSPSAGAHSYLTQPIEWLKKQRHHVPRIENWAVEMLAQHFWVRDSGVNLAMKPPGKTSASWKPWGSSYLRSNSRRNLTAIVRDLSKIYKTIAVESHQFNQNTAMKTSSSGPVSYHERRL